MSDEDQPSERAIRVLDGSTLAVILSASLSHDGSSDIIREQVAGVAAGLSQYLRPGVDLPKTGTYANVKPTKVDVNASTQDAYNYLVNTLHYKPKQAIGVVANLYVESGCNPHGPAGDGGLAIGICQWHPDRQAKCREAMGFNLQSANLHQQLDFMDWELHHTEKAAGDKLWATTDPRDAAAVISSYYERPLDKVGNEVLRARTAAGLTARLEKNADAAPFASQNAPAGQSTPTNGIGGPVYLYNMGRNDVGQSTVLGNPEKYRYDVMTDLMQLAQSGGRVVVVPPLSELAPKTNANPSGLNQGVEDARAIAMDVAKKLKEKGYNIEIADLHGAQIPRGANGFGVHPRNYADVSTLLEPKLAELKVKPTDQIIAVGDSILRGTMDSFQAKFPQYKVKNLAVDGAHADPKDPKHEEQMAAVGANDRRRDKLQFEDKSKIALNDHPKPTMSGHVLAQQPTA